MTRDLLQIEINAPPHPPTLGEESKYLAAPAVGAACGAHKPTLTESVGNYGEMSQVASLSLILFSPPVCKTKSVNRSVYLISRWTIRTPRAHTFKLK